MRYCHVHITWYPHWPAIQLLTFICSEAETVGPRAAAPYSSECRRSS